MQEIINLFNQLNDFRGNNQVFLQDLETRDGFNFWVDQQNLAGIKKAALPRLFYLFLIFCKLSLACFFNFVTFLKPSQNGRRCLRSTAAPQFGFC